MPIGVIRALYLSVTTDQSKIKAAEAFRKISPPEVNYFTFHKRLLSYCLRSAGWLFDVENVG
jgi:hypothetical protein